VAFALAGFAAGVLVGLWAISNGGSAAVMALPLALGKFENLFPRNVGGAQFSAALERNADVPIIQRFCERLVLTEDEGA
jgi:hypothetical protein